MLVANNTEAVVIKRPHGREATAQRSAQATVSRLILNEPELKSLPLH